MDPHPTPYRWKLLMLLTVLTFTAQAQRPDSRSFEHLWTLYDGFRYNYVQSRQNMLDTIGWKAEAEHNAYQLFIANRLRLDLAHKDKSLQQTVLWLDSLRRDNAGARWGDRDSLVYRSLYHYFIGVLLTGHPPYKGNTPSIADADFGNMELWSAENFRNAAREQFFACLDNMPRDVSLLTHRWDFLLSMANETRSLHPTLNDVIFQDILRLLGDQDTTLAIALIDEAMMAHTERNILIDYEIQRLHYLYPTVDEQVYSSACWRKLDLLENTYGPDIAFDYDRGVLLAAADQLTDRETDYKARALEFFHKVVEKRETAQNPDAVMRHYALNAYYYIERLTMPSLILSKAQTDLPLGHKLRVPVQYSNLDTVYLSVFKCDYLNSFHYRYQLDNREIAPRNFHYISSVKKLLEWLGEPVLTQQFVLYGNVKSRLNTTELWVDSLPVGNYHFVFHLNPTIDSAGLLMATKFRVTRLKIANWEVGFKACLAVNDVRTGEPLNHIRTSDGFWDLYTNRFGETRTGIGLYNSRVGIYDHRVEYLTGLEEYPYRRHYFRPFYFRRYRNSWLSQIVTDRTLYRPGQTVHLKVLLLKKGKAKRNVPVEVWLSGQRGNNYVTTDTLRLVTSQYGSVGGELKLPPTVGRYRVVVRYPFRANRYRSNEEYLEVAEYKLPTFKVKLLPDTLQAALGDSLPIRGTVTALNGLPVSNAAVSLNVHTEAGLHHDRFEVVTGRDGYFEHHYPVDVSPYHTLIRIDVEAIVTDVNGETHRDTMLVLLPPKLLTVKLSGRDEWDLAKEDTATWMLRAVNFRDVSQPVPVRIAVVRLQAPAEYKIPVFLQTPAFWMPLHSEEEYAKEFPHLTFAYRQTFQAYWPVIDTVFRTEDVFMPDSLLRVDIRGWKTGNYRIIATTTDKAGKEVMTMGHFSMYSSQLPEYAPQKPIHLAIVSSPEKKGGPITLSVGSCLRNAVMICDIYQGSKRLKTCRIPLDREQKTITVKTRSTGVRGLNLIARIVQNGELHTISLDTVIPLEDKTIERYTRSYRKLLLNAELTRWRNETEPGNHEHWEITLSDGKQKAVRDAELLAWMFDGSLYELGMEPPKLPNGHSWYGHSKKLPRTFRTLSDKISCSDLSESYSEFCRYKKSVHEKSVLKYESLQLPYGLFSRRSNTSSGTSSGMDLEEIVITYEPPAFSMDMTVSSPRLSGENIRTTPGRSVTDALANLEGVSSVDGTMTSVRGNRSDGQQIIVDGVRTRTEPVVTVNTDNSGKTANEHSLSPDVTPRRNFVETAFFYPNLHPDDIGRVHIDFTLPEQYTGWEFHAFAHTKKATMNGLTALLQSRRTLMLQTNAPRFFREGDTLTLRAKVTNRSVTDLDGTVTVEFFNAENNQPVKMLIDTGCRDAKFCVSTNGITQLSIPAGASEMVQFRIFVPAGVTAIGYRMVARAVNYGDGEERLLPVLPNKMLVTESYPFVVPANTDTALTFNRFRTYSTSTMQPMSYTVEVTTNPAWLAIRSLPYLLRYPYDCNEQTFSKLFAAATVQHAIAQNPGLREVFTSWLNDTVNNALASPLLKNESLQSMLLEETPWLQDAQNESRQRQETARLFADENLQNQLDKSLNKLLHNQLPNGGWDWYGRYSYSRYITDHLVAGFYKLQRLGVEISRADQLLEKAIRKSDQVHEEDYKSYLKRREEHPETQFYFTEEDIHYLYARSFAPHDSAWLSKPYVQNLMTFMTEGLEKAKFTLQAEVALILHRTGREAEAKEIMEYIRQQSLTSREKGMYWHKEYSGYYYRWYEAPIERQALLIEAFTEISPREDELTAMKQWLLMQKESNSWNSTKATAEAVYALLLGAPADLLQPATTVVSVGGKTITDAEETRAEAGTGHLQQVWNQEVMTPDLANIKVRTDSVHPTFGAAYWQYLEVPDKVEAAGSGLSVRRRLYHQPAVGDGHNAAPVTDENPIRLGERITVRIVVTTDRDLEYVQLKDPRAAAFEPVNIHEREGRQNGVRWVESPRDASVCFFISRLPQGTVVLEYDVFATQSGDFSNAATTVECMYAPEYRAQCSGQRVTVR